MSGTTMLETPPVPAVVVVPDDDPAAEVTEPCSVETSFDPHGASLSTSLEEVGRRPSFFTCTSSEDEEEWPFSEDHMHENAGVHKVVSVLKSFRPLLERAREAPSSPARTEGGNDTPTGTLERFDWCVEQIEDYIGRIASATSTRESIRLILKHKLDKTSKEGGEDAEVARWVEETYTAEAHHRRSTSQAGNAQHLPSQRSSTAINQESNLDSPGSIATAVDDVDPDEPFPDELRPGDGRSFYRLVSPRNRRSSMPVMLALSHTEDGGCATVEDVTGDVDWRRWREMTQSTRRKRWAKHSKKDRRIGEDQPRRSLEYAADDEEERRTSVSAPALNTPVIRQSPHVFSQECENLLNHLHEWGLDTFALDEVSGGRPLTALSMRIMKQQNLMTRMDIDPTVASNFFSAIEDGYSRYPEILYHNNVHAADVTHSTFFLLQHPALANVFSDLEIFAATVAAAVHDVGHLGVTNQFLIATQSDLAVLYNDQSVLENHHASTAFRLLKHDELNVTENFDPADKEEFRRIVITMIMSTDMAKHFEFLSDFRTMVEEKRQTSDSDSWVDMSDASDKDRMLVLCAIVHCADLGASTKPWDICYEWCQRIMHEFFRQGDREAELGLEVGPLHDRNTTSIPRSQTGFVDFIVLPLWETWDALVSNTIQMKLLAENRARWQAMYDEEQSAVKKPEPLNLDKEPEPLEPQENDSEERQPSPRPTSTATSPSARRPKSLHVSVV